MLPSTFQLISCGRTQQPSPAAYVQFADRPLLSCRTGNLRFRSEGWPDFSQENARARKRDIRRYSPQRHEDTEEQDLELRVSDGPTAGCSMLVSFPCRTPCLCGEFLGTFCAFALSRFRDDKLGQR